MIDDIKYMGLLADRRGTCVAEIAVHAGKTDGEVSIDCSLFRVCNFSRPDMDQWRLVVLGDGDAGTAALACQVSSHPHSISKADALQFTLSCFLGERSYPLRMR